MNPNDNNEITTEIKKPLTPKAVVLAARPTAELVSYTNADNTTYYAIRTPEEGQITLWMSSAAGAWKDASKLAILDTPATSPAQQLKDAGYEVIRAEAPVVNAPQLQPIRGGDTTIRHETANYKMPEDVRQKMFARAIARRAMRNGRKRA